MKARTFRPLGALCGLVALAAISHASVLDASILLERAANNRMITVKYEGVAAASLEMVINKVTVLTKQLEANDGKGELQLPVDTATLPNGESTVEVRLLDAKGVLVGTEITKINIDRSGSGPAFLELPRSGDTVQGLAEIKVGFKSDMSNVFVSFFIDDEFKAMRNNPPFGYTWDTTKVLNGPHEVQAWAVDVSDNTYRTEKFVIFVNNPGGMTKRQSPLGTPATPATTPVKPAADPLVLVPVATAPKGTLPALPRMTPAVAAKPAMTPNSSTPTVASSEPANVKIDGGTASPVQATQAVDPAKVSKPAQVSPVSAPTPDLVPVNPPVQTPNHPGAATATPQSIVKPLPTDKTHARQVEPVAAAKPVEMAKIATSVKPVTAPPVVVDPVPVGPVVTKPVEVAKPAEVVKAPVVNKIPEVSKPIDPVTTSAVFVPKMVPITTGVHLPNIKDFGIVMDGVTMKFDVPGRVQKGVPTGPVRYLFERKGLNVNWNQKDKSVTANNADTALWLQIGNPIAKFNGQDVTMESAPYLYHSRSFVPMSFIGRVLDVDVTFDPTTQHMMVLSHNMATIVAKPDTK